MVEQSYRDMAQQIKHWVLNVSKFLKFKLEILKEIQLAPHSWGFLFVGGWVDLVCGDYYEKVLINNRITIVSYYWM